MNRLYAVSGLKTGTPWRKYTTSGLRSSSRLRRPMTSGVAWRYVPSRRISWPVASLNASMFPRIFTRMRSSPRRAATSKLFGRIAHRSLTTKPASSNIAVTFPTSAERDIGKRKRFLLYQCFPRRPGCCIAISASRHGYSYILLSGWTVRVAGTVVSVRKALRLRDRTTDDDRRRAGRYGLAGARDVYDVRRFADRRAVVPSGDR